MGRCFFAVVLIVAVACLAFLAPVAHSIGFHQAVGNMPQLKSTADGIGNLLAVGRPVNIFRQGRKVKAVASKEEQPVEKSLLTQMPLPGERITSVFGFRIHPIFRRRIFHEGLDFHAGLHEPVHCVLDGVVVFAGRKGGFGRAVAVYHPSAHAATLYAHLSRLNVRQGQALQQGDVVGLAGSTGLSTGVHLHFGVRSDQGQWLDPVAFLKQVPSWESACLRARGDAVYGAYLCARAHQAQAARAQLATERTVSPLPVAPIAPVASREAANQLQPVSLWNAAGRQVILLAMRLLLPVDGPPHLVAWRIE